MELNSHLHKALAAAAEVVSGGGAGGRGEDGGGEGGGGGIIVAPAKLQVRAGLIMLIRYLQYVRSAPF